MRRRPVALLATLALAALAACTAGPEDVAEPSSSTPAATPLEISADIPREEAAVTVPTRLAEGLAAPTNRWFSGLVFGDAPQPVFPSPLSFAWADGGFAVGLPTVTASGTTVFGSAVADVALDLGAESMLVTGYDDASVTITALDGGGSPVADVRIAQGWPAVQVTAAADLALPLAVTETGDGVWAISGAERWGLASDTVTSDGSSLTLPAGQSARLFATPEGVAVADAAAWFGTDLSEVVASAAVGSEAVTTTIAYTDAPTLLVAPATVDAGCADPGYATLYGTAAGCVGTELSWSVPRVTATPSLDVAQLTDDQLEQVAALIPADVAALTDPSAWPGDSYFGGKALYRAAVLADLADAVGDSESAETMWAALTDQLLLWADPTGCEQRDERCVVYDTAIGGYLAQAPSFGSDEFNDHHFHYGYLVYAAALAARHDPALIERLAPVINAYVADIASPVATDDVPRNRTFDPYWGHSWASGYSPFADGNNQESVSEAMLAWTGVALWAEAIGDDGLLANATWMLSAETEAARTQWLAPDLSAVSGYDHTIVSLLWGGKLDYATWFSAEPTAMLGILLIPMPPTSAQLAIPAERIEASVAEAMPDGATGPLADYVLMYSALAGPEQAEAAASTLADYPTDQLDNGLTRSYAVAWALAAANAG